MASYKKEGENAQDPFEKFLSRLKPTTFVIKKMQDIRVDEQGVPVIRDGDFHIGESTLQHQHHLLIAQKGEYKDTPEIGVGIADQLNGEGPKELLIKAKRNFEYDGMRVDRLEYDAAGKIYVEARYT